jgi:hypothetical protein
MTITIMGGFLVATVLTLPVVPPLYEMWFRVRIDEPLEGSIHPELVDRSSWEAVPFRIAAE